ncbi:MAG: hypothetical protein U0232_08070 [Thermomicrobiales bacterium]
MVMARTYNAFLVRHWSLDAERGKRIEVVHVQSGDRSLVASMSQAATWMQTWADSEGHPDPARTAAAAHGESSADPGRPSLPPIIL